MPSPVRHILSVLIGIVATAALVVLLPWMTALLYRTALVLDVGPRLGMYAGFLLIGVLVGVLAGSRLSPVGALGSGVVLVVLGLLFPSVQVPEIFPGSYHDPVPFLLVGGVLLTSAVFPHRWRSPDPPAHTISPSWQPPHGPSQSAMYAPPYSAPPHSAPPNSPWPQGPGQS